MIMAEVILVVHLLHEVPSAVAAKIRQNCVLDWPNSPFNQGWCADIEAAQWITAHTHPKPSRRAEAPPEILIAPPDVLMRPDPRP